MDQKKVPGKKFHVSVAGCTNGAHETYVNDLKGLGQIEVISPEQSDYLVLFCPIASQVGTDIKEAMDKIPGGKPIVLVVMHHTYNKDNFVPESRRLVENPDVIVTVDVLFHESKMLICNRNDMAWFQVKDVLVVSPGQVSSWHSSADGKRYSVRAGDEVTLPCANEIEDQDECGETSWIFRDFKGTVTLFEDRQIHREAKSDRLSVTEKCALVIKKVTEEDAGLYICRQFSRSGQQQGPYSLVDLSVVASEDKKTATTPTTTAAKINKKPGEDAGKVTTVSTTWTAVRMRAAGETTNTAPEDNQTEPEDNNKGRLRLIIVSVGLAALIITVVTVNIWTRAKGSKAQTEENMEQIDEDEDEVDYENDGEASTSV